MLDIIPNCLIFYERTKNALHCTQPTRQKSMMSKTNKTTQNNKNVEDFLNEVGSQQKRNDCLELAGIMAEITKEPAKMWGESIVGFGSYHYKYESGHEGDSCIVGFSPRKQNIVLYTMAGGTENYTHHLKQLGKHKIGSSCLYINKIADIDISVLKNIIKESVAYMRKKHKI